MTSQKIFDKIAELKIVPVIAIDSVDAALPLADALLAGGLPVAEITFRTDAAAAVMRKIARERPEMLLGAGTVLTPQQLRHAADAGAEFAVSPGFNPDVVREAADRSIPFAPGVMTPTDVEAALAQDLRVLKFFPAGAAGGPKFLKSLAAPYSHTGVKFIPTGGVNVNNLAEYLNLDVVGAVGGSWIAKRDVIAAKDWGAITEAASHAVEIARK